MARLANPELTLSSLGGLVILDEIQRMPELYTVLRVLADRPGHPARFLILGSASPDLIKGASESLAGRVSFIDVSGFSLREVGADHLHTRWWRGGFPSAFLARNDGVARQWHEDFFRTFLERDIPQLGIRIPAMTLRRFWTMVAHYHGQILNQAELARSLGSSEPTARHSLLRIPDREGLQGHPKLGASWEGFCLEQILDLTGDRDAYYWATHTGAELDLLLFYRGKRIGGEFKFSEAPRVSKSMRVSLDDLKLDHLFVIHPGRHRFPLHPDITASPLLEFLQTLTSPDLTVLSPSGGHPFASDPSDESDPSNKIRNPLQMEGPSS